MDKNKSARIVLEVTRDESEFRVSVVEGNVPSMGGMTYPEFLADYDGCFTPGEALRVFADACDRSMAAAWFEASMEEDD